jgi:glucans biosynthesis protein
LTLPKSLRKACASWNSEVSMSNRVHRRHLLVGAVVVAAAAPLDARAQVPAPPAAPPPPAAPQVRFGLEDVVRRARELAATPYDPQAGRVPDELAALDFDAWRDIRFRPERAMLNQPGSLFRLQTFHPGFLHARSVTVNLIRDGIPAPVPYQAALFDYGRNRFERPLPVSTGFAGFRLHYPLNDPRVYDELVSFLGASYFRVLGGGQRYGLSARGLAIGVGARETEEFPFFREFWVETPEPNAERAVVYALLDGPSVTGAYQFVFYPGTPTTVDVSLTLFARRAIPRLGLAPLTSMFFTGENDRRFADDYRPELHDSDGLLMHTSAGEWLWRPLRNPQRQEAAAFVDTNLRGFGLMQRDRTFEHYQDLDLHYELRPSYWVEPLENWGEGAVELFEIPTSDETNDNIVAAWAPKVGMEAGQSQTWRYKLTATMADLTLSPGGKVINTYRTRARALGSSEPVDPRTTRFIVDFAGGRLPFYLPAPDQVQVVPSATNGRILRTFVVPNPKTQGFRAGIDVQGEAGQTTDLRAFLRAGTRTLTETWTFPWRAD